MRLFYVISIVLPLCVSACREKTEVASGCMEITPGVAFDAKVHETWCLPDESVKITVGHILDDSRCNVLGIDCVWAGKTDLELQIETKEIPFYRDTLSALYNLKDTISIGSYSLELVKVFPEMRTTFDVDTTNYSFRMILE